MSREDILGILRREKPRLQAKYGLTAIGVFGSVARGEERPDSDADIVVEVPIVNGWDYMALYGELAEAIGGEVDIIRLRPSLEPSLRRRIESDAIYV